MARFTNQRIEQHYFEQFRLDYSLPIGNVQYADKPDVIIQGQQSLGVEITNLYIDPGTDPASEQIQRVWRKQAIQRAQTLFIERGGRKIELSFDFEPSHPIEEIEPLANELAELACRLAAEATGNVNPLKFFAIKQLRSVYYNAIEYEDAKWRLIQIYTVPLLSVDRLRQVVADKAKKHKGYSSCERYWLLIVIDFMDFAQDQQIEWPEGQALGVTPYEKVLLYKPQAHQVVEVPQY